jgi:hypothetical protein
MSNQPNMAGYWCLWDKKEKKRKRKKKKEKGISKPWGSFCRLQQTAADCSRLL